MKHKIFIFFILFIFLASFQPISCFSAPGRYETELSGSGWKLKLDLMADWQNDTIFLPPSDIKSIPVNQPAFGWNGLQSPDREVSVPGTVEEYFWGANGNPVGIAGDYRGVSWWSRKFTIDNSLKGKKIILYFESVNLRAEVYVNRKLCGYDVVGNTPFETDITDAVVFGEENSLDIRITDPVGNFTWEDNDLCRWGNNEVPPVHGFGGITGRIYLRATDSVRIADIYVENKPSVKDAEVFVTVDNSSGKDLNGRLELTIHKWNNPSDIIWTKTLKKSLSAGKNALSFNVSAKKAIPWNIRDPHLYTASVKFVSDDGSISDSASKRFGFRYFTVGEKNGDKRFYLNGRRVFVFAAMTRGFWPKNGIFPTPEMAKRDIDAALKLGFNMMLFHRAIGQAYMINLCDEAGLLVYEEPSGYRCEPAQSPAVEKWRREKLKRMVIRERSNPSMVIYNLKNEAQTPPSDDDIANMKLIHSLDPGRIVTYNSHFNRENPYNVNKTHDPYKSHILPFDSTIKDSGWFDHHHWFRYPGYVDEIYNNPRFFMRGVVSGPTDFVPADSLNTVPKDEIVFWGEEGQWGTMMRLEKIRDQIMANGGPTGFREQAHLNWFDSYNNFLDKTGFRQSFPSVDSLTLSMGASLHYFHGRVLENTRMGNISDGYNLNGWAAPETSEDIVDVYRNITADPSILSHYTQPLYVAVKMRDKVLPTGAKPIADIFIVNEKDVKGKHTIELTFENPDGQIVFTKSFEVSVTGGEEYGQLLVEGVVFPAVEKQGHYTLTAILKGKKGKVADGFDNIFTVDAGNVNLKLNGAVIDTSGTINAFLSKNYGVTLPDFDPKMPAPDFIIIGAHDFRKASSPYRSRYINPVMDYVANGTKLIVLNQADKWALNTMDNLFTHPAVEFKRTVQWGSDGRYIAKKSPYLDGLPQSQAWNWECQAFYKGTVWGLDLGWDGIEPIVALACENRRDIVNALVRVPYGRGQVFLSSLDILNGLTSEKPQSVVQKKLLLNLITFTVKK